MNFTPPEKLNMVQLIFTKNCLPKSIETVEWIIENKEFGSGSPEEWDKRLKRMREYYQEILAFCDER